MAIHIPDNLDRYVVLADGFIPSKETINTMLLTNNANEATYVEHFGLAMSKIYHDKLDGKKSHNSASLFLMNPQRDSALLGKCNPIQDELESISDSRENYRIFLMMMGAEDEPQEMKDAFHKTLSDLEFKIRDESTFKNLLKFREYLGEISENVIERYVAPFLQVEKDLNRIGLDSENTFIA